MDAITSDRFPALTPELVSRLDVAGPRYTSYPTAPEWSDDFGPDDYAGALRAAAARRPDEPLSLYVHIPFCREMCRYCGCNVVATRDTSKADRYLDVLEREVALVASHLGSRRTLSRLHYGGGTPTFLDETQLSRLWAMLTRHFVVRPDAEVAIEIDPVVTRTGQLALLRQQGFNRLSMGVQDFDPAVQEAVNRFQTLEETRLLVDAARDLGFRSVNLDLIYGLPRQTPASWRRTLESILGLRPDRLSLFSFAYVPQVKPHQRLLPIAGMPTGWDKLELFRVAHDTLLDSGYRSIGMDHFALPDDELARAKDSGVLWRDFQGYTIHRAADTMALGMTGISGLTEAYAQGARTLKRHEELVAAGRLPVERGHLLSDDDRARRALITEVMCNFSVDLGASGAYALERDKLAPLVTQGLVELDGTRVLLTPLGRLFVRNVAMVFDAYLEREGRAGRPTYSRTV